MGTGQGKGGEGYDQGYGSIPAKEEHGTYGQWPVFRFSPRLASSGTGGPAITGVTFLHG